jgi:hypothetical protein
MHMNKHSDSFISCEICSKEIPKSAATTFEGDEYVWHFCGNACYRKFQNEIDAEQEEVVPHDKFSSESRD